MFLLNENHRSSRQILDFVNFIFGQIMTEEGAEIDYDEGQKLNPAKDSPNDNIPRVVVVDRLAEFWKDCDIGAEVSEEDEETESEAEGSEQSDDGKLSVSEKARRQKLALCFGVYKEIRNYLDEDKSHKREDICVLTKTVSKGKMIAEFLKSLGIKCVSDNKTKIFEDMHIQSVMNLIILLGNEYRDEYLMSVMLRNFRFTNFTLDDLATINVFIRNNQKKYSSANLMVRIRVFCDTAEDSELKTRLNDFLDVFDDLRMTSRVGDIDDLVDRIYSESGVMANVISEDNIGVAKLVLLKDWLSSNFKRYGTDIGTVAAKLEEMRHTFNSDASFSSRDTDSDAVTFMSIHKSKGLEFPFVVLAFDDGQENNDSMGNIIFDKTNGFIANDFDDELISMRPSAERYVYDNAKSRTSNSEELRLLYVALTRAERRLSVVTAVDFGMREKGVACTNGALLNSLLNREDTFGLRHWLEGTGKLGYAFISGICRASCASGLRHSAGFDDSEFGRIIDYSGFEVDMVGTDGLKDIDTLMKTAGEAVRDHVRTTREMPKYPEYSDTETIKTPFKVAVTGIRKTKISETTHVDLTIRDKEEYLDKLSGKITAAGKGTIVHLILQWADPEVYVNGRDALLDNVRELMNYEVFRRYDESEVLAIAEEFADGIVAFAKTDVGKALNEADKNGRAEFEKPIVFAVPSHDKAELEDFVLVQGVIDSIYEEDDGSVIVDYKTDNYGDISEAELETKASARHAFQIDCYAASCEASGIKIKAKYLYLVRYGVLVRI